MSEAAVKQRFNRAVRSAMRCIDQPKGSYTLVLLTNGPFHFEAVREREIRKVRIVLDKISAQDERAVRDIRLPGICTKEIWCKKQGNRGFEKREAGN
jgi:hypothetical protein